MAVLAGRVAVTGAPAGIGAGLAAMLAAQGATVVPAARREAELARVADGIRQRGGAAIPVVTDLTSGEPIARLLATAMRKPDGGLAQGGPP
jgi:NADP-dependent 3-hydroxy acid dehydrogenase YdfG